MYTILEKRISFNHSTTQIANALVQKQDIKEIFRIQLEQAVNHLLESELTVHLDYEKYNRIGFNSGNSRNGYYSRSIHTEYGTLNLRTPRDRNGDFSQQTVTLYKRHNDALESFVIYMHQIE